MNSKSRFQLLAGPSLTAIVLCTMSAAFAAGGGLAPAGQTKAASESRQEDREAVAIREGRALVDLIGKRDADTFFARFDPEMAKALPLVKVRPFLNAIITDRNPLGERITEDVSEENGALVYTAQHQWASNKRLKIVLSFSDYDAKRLSGFTINSDDSPLPQPLSDETKAGVLVAGRSVAELIRKGNTNALVARFTPGMAKTVPKARIEATLKSFFSDGSMLGEVISEKVTPAASPDIAVYTGRLQWKPDQAMTLTVHFVIGSGGKIAGLRMSPEMAKELPPDPHAGYRLKTPLHLPFAPGEEWHVVWGGDTRQQNYHVIAQDQRHAYDIVIQKDGSTHEGDGKSLEQYYAYGKPLFAPAAGKVIEADNEQADNAIGETDTRHPFGNHILLDIGNGEYVAMAHMQHGSLTVKVGDTISLGQQIGRCGNSGHSSEPHLHVHVQDKPYTYRDALGLPATFIDYTSNGKTVASGAPVRGESIAALSLPSPTSKGKTDR